MGEWIEILSKGILQPASKAELRLATLTKVEQEEADERIGKLKEMVESLEEIKQSHGDTALLDAVRAVDRLKEVSPERYEEFIHERADQPRD
ncbi:hypothetical protein ACKWRH_26475 [Bradyrhizobium sp. Pa8]|uniref:hypothetical protein n=1 Tax=Bradyrhizobium sp. Pa8 TaxID=3386552 RepID=UPI00403F5A90